jgi:hypothetical protein
MVDCISLPFLPNHSADILLHEEIPLILHLKGFGIVDELADSLQGRLFDFDGFHVEEEGHSKAEVAVGDVIVVECVLGGGELDGEFLVYWYRSVECPVVKRIGEVSGGSFKEDGQY